MVCSDCIRIRDKWKLKVRLGFKDVAGLLYGIINHFCNGYPASPKHHSCCSRNLDRFLPNLVEAKQWVSCQLPQNPEA